MNGQHDRHGQSAAQRTAVNRVVGAFLRAGAPAEAADLRQEAFLVCIELAPRVTSEVTAVAFYSTAIRRRLGRMVSRQLACVSLPNNQLRHAREYQHRESPDQLAHDWTPERQLACHQVQSEVDRLLGRRIGGRVQRPIDVAFGADRLEVLLRRPTFLAMARGASSVLADLWQLLRSGGH